MAQVSIGQVENLSHAITAIGICAEEAETEASWLLSAVEQKLAETESFLNESIQLVQAKEDALAIAEAVYAAAEIAHAAAKSVFDLDISGSPGTAAAYAAACAALAAAESARETAARNLDLARTREEMARSIFHKAQALYEHVGLECSARITVIRNTAAEGRSRLEHAREALDAYLASNANAKAVYTYLNRRPPAGKPALAGTVHKRTNLDPPQQKILFQYLMDTNPVFRAKAAGYREALNAARGHAERDTVFAKMLKELSGEFSEKMTASEKDGIDEMLLKNTFGGDPRIAIAVIPKEKSNEARECVSRLEKALEEADINNLLKEKDVILAMAETPVIISGKQWEDFLAQVRNVDAEFKAEYLLDKEAQKLVLKADLKTCGDGFDRIILIFNKACETGALVLELPLPGEADA